MRKIYANWSGKNGATTVPRKYTTSRLEHRLTRRAIAPSHFGRHHRRSRTRPPFAKLVREVQTNCIAAGLEPPHLRTIKARLEDIDLQKRAKLRGEAKLIKATTAMPGELHPSRPLEIVQIDHTKADVFVVDEETRDPIGRPWLGSSSISVLKKAHRWATSVRAKVLGRRDRTSRA